MTKSTEMQDLYVDRRGDIVRTLREAVDRIANMELVPSDEGMFMRDYRMVATVLTQDIPRNIDLVRLCRTAGWADEEAQDDPS